MLSGIVRESIGKKDAKALRRDGYLIANIYGAGVSENVHCAFKKNEFIKAVKSKSTLIFPVLVGDKEIRVVISEYQKEPVSSDLLHVDLYAIKDGVEANFKVPVKTTGVAIGIKNKGVLITSKRRVAVRTTPEKLPNEFVLDVSKLDVGNSILIRDIVAPDGVRMLDRDDVAVVGVIKAK